MWNELFQNGQSFLTLFHIGKISPNLVTLDLGEIDND